MMTVATPYAIWVLKQASDKLPYELDEAAIIDGASPLQLFRLVYLPLMTPSLVAIGIYAVLLAWNEYLYASCCCRSDTRHHAAGRARAFPAGRRLALGAADGHGPHLRAAAGGDLLRVQALHGRRPDRGRGEELMAAVAFRNIPEVLRCRHASSTASRLRDRRRRVHVFSALRLRQDHHLELHRRPRGRRLRAVFCSMART